MSSTLQSLLKAATGEADKDMLTDAPLLFPPGQVIVFFLPPLAFSVIRLKIIYLNPLNNLIKLVKLTYVLLTEEVSQIAALFFFSWRWLLCVLQMGFSEWLTLIGCFSLFLPLWSSYNYIQSLGVCFQLNCI